MILKITSFTLLLTSTMAFSGTKLNFIPKASLKPKRAWDKKSNPINIFQNKTFERNYFNLKVSNYAEKKPWSDSYWPSYTGGIAYRWITKETPFNIEIDEEYYKNLSTNEIAQLSPAEKFDLLQGRYDVPTFQSEKNRTSPSDPAWEGLCHGWAPASLLYNDPQAVTLTNPDGLEIQFGSSDVKALLTYYTANQYQLENNVETLFAGSRCNDKDTSNCANTNAGAFHLIITNMIEKKTPMVMDIDRGIEVWNQPIYGYTILNQFENQTISPKAAQGTVRQLTIEMRVDYVEEVFQSWDNGIFQSQSLFLKYTLELDINNKIIGGEWLSNKRPDFIWTISPSNFSAEYYGALKNLYEKSTNTNGSESRSTNSRDGISVGDQVLETYQSKSIVTVKEIRENGDYYVTGGDEGTGGDWYSRGNLQKLVSNFEGIQVNDQVVESYQTSSFVTVKYITEKGLYFLIGGDEGNTGDWYSKNLIKKLVSQLNGISINDEVLEKYQTPSVVYVKYISEDGNYYLTGGDEGTGGDWYSRNFISRLVDSYKGFYRGETVLETYQTSSYAKIQYITEDGLFYLRGGDEGAGGDWYNYDLIKKQ